MLRVDASRTVGAVFPDPVGQLSAPSALCYDSGEKLLTAYALEIAGQFLVCQRCQRCQQKIHPSTRTRAHTRGVCVLTLLTLHIW